MSIIYNTLQRLETGDSTRVDNPAMVSRLPLTGEPSRYPIKILTAAMMLLFAGTSLMVWQSDDWLDEPVRSSLAIEKSPLIESNDSEHKMVHAETDAQTSPESQGVQKDIENLALSNEPDLSAEPMQTGGASITGPETVNINGNSSPTQNRPVDESLVLTSEESSMFDARITMSESDTVVTQTQQEKLLVPFGESNKTESSGKFDSQPTEQIEAKTHNSSPLAAQNEHGVGSADQTTHHQAPKLVEVTSKPLSSPQPQPSERASAVVEGKAEQATTPVAMHETRKQQSKVLAATLDNEAQLNRLEQTIEQARVALSQEQYLQALSDLEALSPLPEQRADFWLIKGSSHLGLGQLESAETAFASAQELAPGNVSIAVQRAIIQQEKGNHVSALQILKNAAIRHSTAPEIFLNQGYSQQELGALREARHSYRIFLRMTEGRSLYAEQREAVNQWLAQNSSTRN